MRKTNLPGFLIIVICLLCLVLFLRSATSVRSAASHIVISQIQIGGVSVDDEFVELYNPTNADINLTGWNLRRKTASQTGSGTSLVASLSGTIKSHGYFLISSPEYPGSGSADMVYSTTTASNRLAANNSVLIYNGSGVNLVDKVGMGSAGDFEASAAANPAAGGSIQRKVDDTGGHGQDTDNNSVDFESLAVSNPRNSQIVITPTNTPIPTDTPTNTPTETPTNTPTPSDTPTPTETPSPSPTSEPISTPTPTQTQSDPSPTATPTLTASPSATPASGGAIIPQFKLVCMPTPFVINVPVLNLKITVPLVRCNLLRFN